MADLKGGGHGIYILRTHRYQDLSERSTDVEFFQNQGTGSSIIKGTKYEHAYLCLMYASVCKDLSFFLEAIASLEATNSLTHSLTQ